MVKITREESDIVNKAIAELETKKNTDSGYNTPSVVAALKAVFHSKCCLCENKTVSSYQIEHLIPHKNDLDIKYDWNNLFLSCAHCNNTKGTNYNPILNCNLIDVDKIIAFRKSGYFGVDEKIKLDILEDSIEAQNTVYLLYDVYYGKTAEKKMEATILRRELRKDISEFKEYVREYVELTNEGIGDTTEKEDLELLIKRELKESAAFAAFKRWLIRDNYPQYVWMIPV